MDEPVTRLKLFDEKVLVEVDKRTRGPTWRVSQKTVIFRIILVRASKFKKG